MAIITISRGTKSHGIELAGRLSERLGYVSKSSDVVLDGARKYNILSEDLLKQLEETPGFWQRMSREHERYLIYVQCALIDAVKQDNVIYHGYAGHLFLRGIRHVLKVRLETPFEERVAAIMKEQNKGFDEASAYLIKIDEERERWFKHITGGQWRDPALYDVSFNTQNLTLDTVSDLIVSLVDKEEFRASTESVRKLENLSLECEVKAAFAADDKLWNLPVSVIAEDGVVTLRGTVKDKKTRDTFAELTSKVKGVKETVLEIGLTSDPVSKGIYGHD
jgi:cytidylate kinase